MRKTRAFLLGRAGTSHCYHVVSRTAGQELLFGDAEKETFRKILLKQLKFSGLRALAWCFMGNHFHLLLEVPDKQAALSPFTEDMLIDRLQIFRNEQSTRLLLAEIAQFRKIGNSAGVTAIANRVRARLFDLSMFMKELKLRMSIAYNIANERRGTLWEGRFKSVLVERGEALRMVAAYIDLNPVRAGLVNDPKDYRWCSYSAAVAGSKQERLGLIKTVGGERLIDWKNVSATYRKLLFGLSDPSLDKKGGTRGTTNQYRSQSVSKAGGKLTLQEALRCKVRYFTDGVALGSKGFVDDFFDERRKQFGRKRSTGARRMCGAEFGKIRILRALRIDPITPPVAPPT